MALPPLLGHHEIRAALVRATSRDLLPGSLLIHGPDGVGRQRLGLWLGQLLLCERPDTEPCGQCTPCKLALRLEHPDLHWFFPLARPRGASGPEKLGEALEDARAAELELIRKTPLRPSRPGEPIGLYLAQVQTIRRLAAARPSMGRRRIFLIGNAELLVPQESSPEAANALLKVLEEPPDEATFMLTTTDPELLLPTIRSRVMPLRLAPLPVELVADYLVEQGAAQQDAALLAARLAEGSIGRALGFLSQDGEPGPLEGLRQQAKDLLADALEPSGVRRLGAAHAASPAGARGAFRDVLAFLTVWIRDLAAVAAGADELVVNRDALEWIRRGASRLPTAAAGAPAAIAAVAEIQALTANNINPQLALAALLSQVGDALAPAAAAAVSRGR